MMKVVEQEVVVVVVVNKCFLLITGTVERDSGSSSNSIKSHMSRHKDSGSGCEHDSSSDSNSGRQDEGTAS